MFILKIVFQTLFAVAISSAGGKNGTTTPTTPTITSTTTKSGPTTSTRSREENLARMDELRNNTKHLREQLHVKQARASTLNSVKELAKKQADAREDWQNATEEVDLSEKRMNLSQKAKDDPTAAKSLEQNALDDANRRWKTANETLLNATIPLQKCIQKYNSVNLSDISSITDDILRSEQRKLGGDADHYKLQIALIGSHGDVQGDEEKRADLQKKLNDTNAKLEILTELREHWLSYSDARDGQILAGDATSRSAVALREVVAQYKEYAALLIQRTNELNDAEKKAEAALTSLIKVEAEFKERERLSEEIRGLNEELNRAKHELSRLEELTRTPPPPQTGKKTQGGNSIPSGGFDRKAYDAYVKKYKERPPDPDRPWRFLCKANGCDNNASDMLVIFFGLGSFLSSLLLAQRVYYCWEEGTHCFERCQRDEVAENGKSKEAKEEKPERKLDDANCSAQLRKRSTRVASAKSTKPPAKR